ncbi:hypothetical protein BH24ACT9_BH24ACT9_12360 [soil metagenome]
MPVAANTLGADPERLLLEAAALRRRQLCAAFVHGSARSWRVRRRVWPAAIAGLLIVAIVIAVLAVAAAFAAQQEIDEQRQSQSIQWGVIGSPSPCVPIGLPT